MKKIIFKTHRNDKIQAKLMSKFLANYPGIEIEFIPEVEEESPENDYMEADDLAKFQKRLENDSDLNYYGVSPRWFCAHVSVKYKGYEADDYLGMCSYNSYEEFKSESGYYFDMIGECINQINSEIESHNQSICKAFELRNLKRTADNLGFYLVPKTAIQ